MDSARVAFPQVVAARNEKASRLPNERFMISPFSSASLGHSANGWPPLLFCTFPNAVLRITAAALDFLWCTSAIDHSSVHSRPARLSLGGAKTLFANSRQFELFSDTPPWSMDSILGCFQTNFLLTQKYTTGNQRNSIRIEITLPAIWLKYTDTHR